MSSAAIAGTAVGAVVGGALVIFAIVLVLCILRRRVAAPHAIAMPVIEAPPPSAPALLSSPLFGVPAPSAPPSDLAKKPGGAVVDDEDPVAEDP